MIGRSAFAALGAALALSGCFGSGSGSQPPSSAAIVTRGPAVPAQRVIGEGSVTVAMLLPLSAGGSASGLAESFQNAAELAMGEVGSDNVRIVVHDTAGEAETARTAAQTAIAGGAELILGPVFAPAVSGAAEPARAAGVPIIAFSTDAGVAGRGTYLLSFLPRQDAGRIIDFAADKGSRTFAALVPDNGYGLVMEAAFREAVAANQGRVVAVERYEPGAVAAAAQRLAGAGAIQAVFVPNGGEDPGSAARALRSAGLNARLLGSGQWDNPVVLASDGLAGAWYPGPAEGGFAAFSERYRARYGVAPPRTASLIYDGTLLANGLAGSRDAAAFGPAGLQASDGFRGVDGIFRLTADGLSERGLSVYQVDAGGGSSVIATAPASFRRS